MLLNTTVNLDMRPKQDGSGFEVCTAYSGNYAQLQIGNVSVAFDDRNLWSKKDDYSGLNMQRCENVDDPVRLNNKSIDGPDAAHRLLFALAADLGYSISKD